MHQIEEIILGESLLQKVEKIAMQTPFFKAKAVFPVTRGIAYRRLGKDEVGGSNPPSSSNKYLKSSDFRCFFVANVDFFVWVKMWGSGLTHTVTHTRKGNNGHKSAGREDLPSRPAFFSLSYMTCSMKLPMVWVASSCFCLVAWV